MYRLRHFRRSTTLDLRRHLIQTLLFPIVDYCSLVFCNISDEQDLMLQRVLNRGIRYIFGIRKGDHVTPFRRELVWLRAKGRRDYFAAILLYKILNTGVPPYLANFFVEKHSLRPQRGVNPDVLIVPSFRTESLRRSFHVSTTYLWNTLPPHIRLTPSLNTSKRLIKSHIFTAEGEI